MYYFHPMLFKCPFWLRQTLTHWILLFPMFFFSPARSNGSFERGFDSKLPFSWSSLVMTFEFHKINSLSHLKSYAWFFLWISFGSFRYETKKMYSEETVVFHTKLPHPNRESNVRECKMRHEIGTKNQWQKIQKTHNILH